VADPTGRWEDVSYDAEGEIKLVADKPSYKPGETARILAQLPKEDAHLLVTTELDNVLSVRQLHVAGRQATIDIPVEARFAPNVTVSVTYVRGSEMFTQQLDLKVPARDKMLNLEIIPNKKEFRPRETASYTVLARNGDGSPAAGAEVSLGVVDESIYQIAPESAGDIRRDFYGQRYNTVQTSFSVNYYFSGYAGTKKIELAQNRRARQLADFKDETTANPLVRKIFKDTAFWQPALVTGPDGKATAKFDLPDNLTTWRATARAVTADTRVGVAVSKVVERKDVIIRVAMPRFLTAGDTVTLSGIVHNYLKADKATKISIEVAGARLLDPAQQTVTIPSQGEYRVNWRVEAPASGDLKVLAKALTDAESDALETAVPVVPRGLKYTRADSFAFADDEADKTVTLTLPANADPSARTLRVEVSPSIAGTLFGALDYLTSYPYGCTEQTMSSFLPNVIVTQALRNVRTATVRDADEVGRKTRRGLKRLYAFQHGDGGWGWWKDDPTTAWMTAYVLDGLAQAERAGYEVDAGRVERGRAALRKMLDENADARGETNPDTRADSFAFAEDEADKTVTFTLPANADPNARTLRVEASPTVTGALFGALDYLTSYPYGCTEQTMSSFLPNVIVTQALQSVQTASVRETNAVGKKVRRGLRRLYGFQHGDGGWGWWKDDPTTAWMTAYVVDGLVQAERAGYEIDAARLEQGRAALRKMLAENADGRGEAPTLGDRAYMAYALAESGDAEMRHLDALFAGRGKLGAYGRALLALGLKERGDRRAEAVAGEIEGAAKGGGADAHWDNSTEATALSVKALARILPQSEVLPRAARWLVGHRRFGHYWLSTRETAFAVFGLIDYVRVSRELDPDYALEVYVGGQQVLQRQVTAADPASMQPFTLQRRGGEVGQTSEVRVVKRGRGAVYLGTTVTHYTNDEQTAEAGVPQLKLRREYLRLRVAEKSDGTLGWQTEPLSGDLRSGDLIVARLKLEGEKAAYLMVEDPIPAGCEQVESVSGIDLNHTEKDWSDWYSAREFRDNRAVLFLNYFDGSAQFQYAMRVQVPGQFRVAPSRAERMYEPDVRANSASGALTILDR
ncbi:MAG TPA: alpha-2-macroglobulin family protein, partial [Pyrinomonadaceae bacterium]